MSTHSSFAQTFPQLRSYAHALTGSNESGDAYLRATLDAVLAERATDAPEDTPRSIYRMFHVIWSGTRESDHDEGLTSIDAAPGTAFKWVSAEAREAILLKSIKSLNDADIAAIMQ
jgi:hypothetical protein